MKLILCTRLQDDRGIMVDVNDRIRIQTKDMYEPVSADIMKLYTTHMVVRIDNMIMGYPIMNIRPSDIISCVKI